MVVSKDAKRKRKEILESSPEMPKRTKVQAQRKFAQGQYPPPSAYSFSGASSSAAGNSQQTNDNREPPSELFKNRPKTEDFLTFLCYRGSNALPPHLDFLNENKNKKNEKQPTTRATNSTKEKQSQQKANLADNSKSVSTTNLNATSSTMVGSSQKNDTKSNSKDNNNKSITTKKAAAKLEDESKSDIIPFAVRKRAEHHPEVNNKSKAADKKGSVERRSLRGRPRINFDEQDEDEDMNGDEYFEDDDKAEKSEKPGSSDKKNVSKKRKKQTGSKKLQNKVENIKNSTPEINSNEELQNSSKDVSLEAEKQSQNKKTETKKSPGKRGPKPKVKNEKTKKSESVTKTEAIGKSERFNISITSPIPDSEPDSGRMTRQRAFFEPVKVSTPDVLKSETSSKIVNDSNKDQVVDFSSDDEKPLSKAIKLPTTSNKKRGRKPQSSVKMTISKKSKEQELSKEPLTSNDSKKEETAEKSTTEIPNDNSPKHLPVKPGRGRPKLNKDKELNLGEKISKVKSKKSTEKLKQKTENLIESADESIDKHTTETPTAIVTEVPKKKRGRKKFNDTADVSQHSQTDFSENETARTARPTRKTKEAATIYMELIGQKLHDFDDEDSFSMDSFPELPNVREMEKVENELKKNVGKPKPLVATIVSNTSITPNKINKIIKKDEKIVSPTTTKSSPSGKKRGPKKKIPASVVVAKKPKIEKKTKKKEQKNKNRKKNDKLSTEDEDEDDILLKEQVRETKRKLEKSFSDSDDEPLANKATKTGSEKDFDESRDTFNFRPKTNGETLTSPKLTLKAPILNQQSPQSLPITSTSNLGSVSARWPPSEQQQLQQISAQNVQQPQKLQLITSPNLIVPPKIPNLGSTAQPTSIKAQQQSQQLNVVNSKLLTSTNNFSPPPPVHVDSYPSPKINPTFLTPKFDRNLRLTTTTTTTTSLTTLTTTPDSPSFAAAQKNHTSFATISSTGVAIGNSSNKLSNSTQNFGLSNTFNLNTSIDLSVQQSSQSQNNPSKSNSPTGAAPAAAAAAADANSPNAIANILAANLMPSKEESGKIFGIASVSLAQSSGPDNTKCTLGKCGSIHKPVLGPVVPTESYLGEQQLSSKERRKAKVNMTHEQIQKWLIECSSNPDDIQDDLDDDYDEVLKPTVFAPTPPPIGTYREDLSGINLLSKAAATLKELPSLGTSPTTPSAAVINKEGNSSWAGKGPSLKATPMLKGDSIDLEEDLEDDQKQLLSKKEKKKLEKKEQLKEKQDKLREKLEAKEKEKQEKIKLKLEKEKNEKERAEKERIEREKLEKEKIEKEKLDKEKARLDKEKQEKERLEKELLEKERLEKERAEKERCEKERREKDRLEKEKRVEKERLEKEKEEKQQAKIENDKKEKLKNKNNKQENNKKSIKNSPKKSISPKKKLSPQKLVTTKSLTTTTTATSKSVSPIKGKRQTVYNSKQQKDNSKIFNENSFGAFSPENEKSVYSFDKEDDDDILLPLSKSFRRQSRRDSFQNDRRDSIQNNDSNVNVKKSNINNEKLKKESNNSVVSLALGSTDGCCSKSQQKLNLAINDDEQPSTSKRKSISKLSPVVTKIEAKSTTTSEFVLNDSEGETFYIPLQGADVAGLAAGQTVEVKVKVGRDGPDGPNQKVCVQATLVTKPQIQTPEKSPAAATASNNHKESPKTRLKETASTGTNSRTLQRVNSNSSLFSGSNKSRGTPNTSTGVSANKKLKDDIPIKMCNNTAFPRRDDPSQMVEAPVFRPTEKEFHDPMEFIDRITPIAARFGICKIIPPASFKPECRVSDDMRFSAYNQYVHKMLHRWGPNVKELYAIRKHCTSQKISLQPFPLIGQIEVDLPRLYHTVQELGGLQEVMEKKKWNRVADEMCIPKLAQDRASRLDDIYCKYLLPYDTLSTVERQKLFDEVEADWAKREARARRNADHCLHSESDSNDDDEDEIESSEDSEEDPADGVSMECIVKGKSMPLKQFFRIARNQTSLWFKNSEPNTAEVEMEFWRHVAVRDSHVCVHSGSIDSSGWGYGFPMPKGKGSPCARHAWNLKVLTNNQGSVLRSLGPVMGVTVPTLHVGMLFSACCWYRDPHGLSWIEYLHTGASKIWYGIPDEQSSNFRKSLTQLIPTHCQNKTIWLPCDTVMVPPHMLTDRGVSLCRIEQKPGEFVVIFPRAYTSSLSTGYVVSESVYFATASWLDLAKEDFKDIHDSCEPAMFSLEQLLFKVASDTRVAVDILTQCLPMLEEVIAKEEAAREQLKATGVKSNEKIINETSKNNKSKKKLPQFTEQDNECDLCRANLYISMIKTHDDNIYCLQHALKNLNKGNILADQCKLIYTYSIEDIQELIKNVKDRLAQKKSLSYNSGKKK